MYHALPVQNRTRRKVFLLFQHPFNLLRIFADFYTVLSSYKDHAFNTTRTEPAICLPVFRIRISLNAYPDLKIYPNDALNPGCFIPLEVKI
jgi:hypothetical protein